MKKLIKAALNFIGFDLVRTRLVGKGLPNERIFPNERRAWKKFLLMIHPYCKDKTLDELRLMSRSKDGQDIFVAIHNEFKPSGFFVEFGGADGLAGSNTYFLEKVLGWGGVIAEPCRGWHEDLRMNRACYISEKCVYKDSRSKVIFKENLRNLELSSIGSFSDESDVEQYEVDTISLNDLLDEVDAPEYIDYLSIDTEGSELEILESIDWTARQFGVVTVEHNHKCYRDDIQRLLESVGYKKVWTEISRNEDWFVLSSGTKAGLS